MGDGKNMLPKDYELEDPTIWWANDQYNVLVNDFAGHATGMPKAGMQYFSKDGIHYTLVNGQVLLKDGKHTGAFPGIVLRGSLARRAANGL